VIEDREEITEENRWSNEVWVTKHEENYIMKSFVMCTLSPRLDVGKINSD
jgi:hypothetical protein